MASTRDDITWRCDVCKRERPDKKIWVFKREITKLIGSKNQVEHNIRYCIDNDQCCLRVAVVEMDMALRGR